MKGFANELSVVARERRGSFDLDFDLSMPVQGFTALFGKSGAGKTSLLRIIAGLDQIANASVRFADLDWQAEKLFIPAHKRRIGYLFQHPSLFVHLDVAANIAYAVRRNGGAELDKGIKKALGIDALMSRKVGSLSGGEKQRVAIARALASNPRLLLMDEPVSALDAKGKDEVLGCLQTVHKAIDIPVVYVSHSLDEVARLADTVVLIRDGTVLEQGHTAEMLLHPEIAEEADARLETLIEAKVVELDNSYGLCRLNFIGGDLWVANKGFDIGEIVRARILARDLSLTLSKQTDTSIQNIVSAEVVKLRSVQGAQVMVELSAGGVGLLAQITCRAADRLKLRSGSKVFAQIKSVALLS